MAGELAGFETLWPATAERLERALRRRRVPEEFIDDVIQETALRLLKTWTTVDQTTLWPLTLTVAGNIIKDDMRRRGRDERLASILPEAGHVDIEERALARLELSRVHHAFKFLSTLQREILFADIYGGATRAVQHSRGSMKMGRLRARRRLREVLDRASAAITLTGIKLRRTFAADGRGNLAESGYQSIAAVALVAAGVDLLMFGGGLGSLDRITSPEKRALSHQAAIDPSGLRDARAAGTKDAPRRSTSSPTRFATTHRTVGTDDGEILGHDEKVGTGGAEGWVRGQVFQQDAVVSTAVSYEPAKCDEEGGGPTLHNSMFCGTGHITVRARVGLNGQSHGVEISTDFRRGLGTG